MTGRSTQIPHWTRALQDSCDTAAVTATAMFIEQNANMIQPLTRRWRSTRVAGLILSAGVALLTTAALSGQAMAVGDGSDPHTTGCDSSAFTPNSSNIQFAGGSGLLEQRFSTSCQTSWARFTCNSTFGCGNYELFIQRTNDGLIESVTVNGFHTGNGVRLYTAQLNDGAGLSAKACLEDLSTGVIQCLPTF